MTHRGRVDLDKMAREYEAARSQARVRSESIVRAVAHIDENLHLVGRTGRFRLESDEPEERGGTDAAPSPLQYFLSGAVF